MIQGHAGILDKWIFYRRIAKQDLLMAIVGNVHIC